MITLNNYGAMLGGSHLGEVRKKQSAMIEEITWDNHMESVTGYFYDWDHDTHRDVLNDLHPELDEYKVPMNIKFIVVSKQTMAKDAISYHLQMKPSQQCVVDYYDEYFQQRYGAEYPVGLYVDLKDSKGIWNRWMVCATADINDPQFPTFELLRCDYVLDAIFDGFKYKIPIVLRSQNSYNSGLWIKYRIETVEDQGMFLVPLNRLTEKIWYNKRYLIDAKVTQDECRAWKVSKINRVDIPGMAVITLAQDHFNPDTDYIEIDPVTHNTVALWADYYDVPITPDYPTPIPVLNKITVAGSQEIKVGGSYKKCTVEFENSETLPDGTWSFLIDGTLIDDAITSTTGLEDNQIKVKLPNNGLYINKIMTIKYTVTATSETVSQEISVVSL